METLQYTNEGLDFALLTTTGGKLTDPAPVPETGVAYLATRNGPRVVVFPNYSIEGDGAKPKENTIYTLSPLPTKVEGECADEDAIAAASGDEDDEDEDDTELEDDDGFEDREFGDDDE